MALANDEKRFASSAPLSVKKTATSSEPPSRVVVLTPSGSAPSVLSKPFGALKSPRRVARLDPEFLGQGSTRIAGHAEARYRGSRRQASGAALRATHRRPYEEARD